MYLYHQLPNGIRLIHRQTQSEVAHCGVFINVGTRDEESTESGMAHFIEHCIFKGTEKRKSFHILNRIDGVGGEMNAYTTKEETCIYASFLHVHYKRSLELFADILFHSIFPQKEVEKEKEVVLDEINSYKDSPVELIFDDFEEMIFAGHPLGRNILGKPSTIKKYTSQDLKRFVERNYIPEKIIISSVGKIDFKKLIALCEKYFTIQSVENIKKPIERIPFTNYVAQQKQLKKKTYQTHCIVGNAAYSFNDSKKIGFMLLSNMLGGPAMNSRLNMAIREKHGYTYNLESSYTGYSDTGIFSIYAGMEAANKEKVISLILRELKQMRENPLTVLQLHKAQIQLIGQIAISNESLLNEMLGIGKSFLSYNKVDSLDEIKKQILAISVTEIQEIANEIFDEKKLSMLVYE